jgi:hypothetical protein
MIFHAQNRAQRPVLDKLDLVGMIQIPVPSPPAPPMIDPILAGEPASMQPVSRPKSYFPRDVAHPALDCSPFPSTCRSSLTAKSIVDDQDAG